MRMTHPRTMTLTASNSHAACPGRSGPLPQTRRSSRSAPRCRTVVAANPASAQPFSSKAEMLLQQLSQPAGSAAATQLTASAAQQQPQAADPSALLQAFQSDLLSYMQQLNMPSLPQADALQALQPQLDQLQPNWQQLQPHWGTQVAREWVAALQQALQLSNSSSSEAANSVVAGLYSALASAQQQLQLPQVDLPALPSGLPQVQLPSFSGPQLPSTTQLHLPTPDSLLQAASSAGAAAQQLAASAAAGAGQLPQQLATGAGGLPQQLAAAAGGSLDVPAHFGSQAVAAWLSQLTAWLQQVVALLDAAQLATAGSGPLGTVLTSWRALLAALSASLPPLELPPSVAGAAASLAAGPAAVAAGAGVALTGLTDALTQLQEQGMGSYSFATLVLVAAGAAAAIAASVPSADALEEADAAVGVQLSYEYDPDQVAAYFEARPLMVAQRAAQLAAEMGGFGSLLAWDLAAGCLQQNVRARAEQLRAGIERLGPAYVKVAQALSTRVDLLTPAYFEQIQLLQDRVPPFPCEDAKKVMAAAFGRPVSQVLSELSEKPVAAASLGQVYRGRLLPSLGGTEVAIKVQRPDVLETVCLDLYLMRQVALAVQSLPDVRSDWAALIDNWAVRFLHEMDYDREAENARVFTAQMAEAGVTGVVTAPVVAELSSGMVLTTEWVNGEKLSESNAADVRELCNTLLNAYLIQLLDTGFLHADPHPGNLIRTPEGKICVLDFGLVTQVTPEQRIALVEYIAHLVTQDWENVARDLQTLGFIPQEAGDPVALGIVPPLGRILSQLSGGGGATKLNIDAVMAELEDLGRTYPFQIPAFFALVLRAFSVIEGIALRVDSDYSIVMECFPYIARRLLSDDDPRVRKALRDVLYGDKQRLDVDRLVRLADAFSAFTTDGLAEQPEGLVVASSSVGVGAAGSGAFSASPVTRSTQAPQQQQQLVRSGASSSSSSAAAGERLSPAVKEALLLVFAPGGSYMQELLVEELVAAVDALSREAASELLRRVLGSAPAVLALSSIEALGPLRPLVLPVPTPVELLTRLAPAVALGPEDEEALGTLKGVFELLQRAAPRAGRAAPAPSSSSRGLGSPVAAAAEAVVSAAGVASELRPLLPELLPGLVHTGQLFVRTLVRRAALRVAEATSLNQEYDQAMAAVAFTPSGSSSSSSPVGVWGPQGPASGVLPSSSNQFGRREVSFTEPGAGFAGATYGAPAGGVTNDAVVTPGSSSSSSGKAAVRAALSKRRKRRQQASFGSSSSRSGSGSSSGSVSAAQQVVGGPSSSQQASVPTAGQLVTALVAAPLLMVFTPLAMLSQQRQYEQQRRDSKWL